MKIKKIKNKLKSSLLVLLVLLISTFSIATPYAQAATGQWWFPRYGEFLDKVNLAPPNEIFGERYTHAQVVWIINTVLNVIVGPIAACADNNEDIQLCISRVLGQGGDPGALLPLAYFGGTLLGTKPASGIDYIAEKADRLGIVQPAYAQEGFGYTNSLSIVRDLWVMMRDAAYSLVIFMILILGFMIMFRAQVSPRTIITVQSALPRVIIGLLLITFSYAIAGLLVDLAFVLQGIIAGVVSASALTGEGMEPIDVFNNLNNVRDATINLFLSSLIGIFSTFGGLIAGLGVAFALISGVGLIVILLIAFVLLIAIIKILWVMIRTYLVIVLLTAISPFIFLVGIVKDGMNGMWFRQMIANLSVFVSVGFFIFIGNVLLFTTSTSGLQIGGQTVTIIDFNYYNIERTVGIQNAVMPGFSGWGTTDFVGAILALGILVSTPKFASSLRDMIASGRVERGGFDLAGGLTGSAGTMNKAYGVWKAPESDMEAAKLSERVKNAGGAQGIEGIYSERGVATSSRIQSAKRLFRL